MPHLPTNQKESNLNTAPGLRQCPCPDRGQDFTRPVVLNLKEELKKDTRTLAIAEIFDKNA